MQHLFRVITLVSLFVLLGCNNNPYEKAKKSIAAGKIDAAAVILDKAYQKDSTRADVQLGYALLRLSTDEASKAVEHLSFVESSGVEGELYEEFLDIKAKTFTAVSREHFIEGENDLAEKNIQVALSARPNMPTALVLRSNIHEIKNEIEAATSAMQQALEFGRQNPQIVESIIEYYGRQKEYVVAKSILEEAGKDLFLGDNTKSWEQLREELAIAENIYSLIEIGTGKPSEVTKRDNRYDYDLFGNYDPTADVWNSNNIQQGFIANHTEHLTLDVEIQVHYKIIRTTTALIFFTQREREDKYRKITIEGLEPGEVREFSSSANTSGVSLGMVGSSRTKVESISVRASLATDLFKLID